jgi:hypothetical protein
VERLSALPPTETVAVPVAADEPAVGRAPHVDAAAPLTFDQAITLLDTIPGVDRRGAEMIVAEIGTEMSRFGTAGRLAAWAGVAPGNRDREKPHSSPLPHHLAYGSVPRRFGAVTCCGEH